MDIVGGLASKGLEWLFDQFGDWSVDWIIEGFSTAVKDILDNVLTSNNTFWEEGAINGFLNFSSAISVCVFVFSILFFLVELAQSAGRTNWVAVISNFIKVIVFLYFNRYIGLGSLLISDILTTNLNLTMQAPNAAELVAGIMSGASLVIAVLLLLVLLIACVGFFVMSMMRNGLMLVQILSSSFYIPEMLNGDTARLGDWLRQTVAIAGTYILQYYMFHLGLSFFLTSPFNCFICWAGMFGAPRVLEKFGYASGASGVFAAAGSVAGAGLSLGKIGGK